MKEEKVTKTKDIELITETEEKTEIKLIEGEGRITRPNVKVTLQKSDKDDIAKGIGHPTHPDNKPESNTTTSGDSNNNQGNSPSTQDDKK